MNDSGQRQHTGPDRLPPDLDRLRVLETWLRLELTAVQDRISHLTAESQTLYRIRRDSHGISRTAVLHHAGCFITGGHILTPSEARTALTDPTLTDVLEQCAQCRPGERLAQTPPT
ncbi:DUF6233 domain-containing protein [Streptomyces sp. 549]|uniref:DUF6233 domain-containing protein n=1 Tax=Streptomyces sp. 549 TaxID=3049076 RepID=UPI0024C25A25|nr:DUF6233 domain-containing protein [Streptomyces sp. 549]MDK1476945.1 DUF6233 domain-containing protein [Streptomyces sp. 549]